MVNNGTVTVPGTGTVWKDMDEKVLIPNNSLFIGVYRTYRMIYTKVELYIRQGNPKRA